MSVQDKQGLASANVLSRSSETTASTARPKNTPVTPPRVTPKSSPSGKIPQRPTTLRVVTPNKLTPTRPKGGLPSPVPTARSPANNNNNNNATPTPKKKHNEGTEAVKQASPYRRRGETTPKNITSSPLRKGVVSGVSHWNRSVSPTDFQAAVTYNVARACVEIRLDGCELRDKDVEHFVAWLRANLNVLRLKLEQLITSSNEFHNEEQSMLAPTDGGKTDDAEGLEADDAIGDEQLLLGGEKGTKSEALLPDARKLLKRMHANLCMQNNTITDTGATILFDALANLYKPSTTTTTSTTTSESNSSDEQVPQLCIRRIYLFKNIIGDVGAEAIAQYIRSARSPLYELHLSHNRIGFRGASAIFLAAKQCSHYPTRSGLSPLWIRLEYNYVPVRSILRFLKSEAITHCSAANRVACGAAKCRLDTKPVLHLYVFELQYGDIQHSERLLQAKSAIAAQRQQQQFVNTSLSSLSSLSSSSSSSSSSNNLVGETEENPGAEKAKSTPIKASTTAQNNKQTLDDGLTASPPLVVIPLYLFLDTNVVISMAKQLESNPAASPTKVAQLPFTFKTLLSKARANQFGEGFELSGDRVCLVITDTVMRELDHLKDAKMGRFIAQKLQSDTGYLAQCAQLGFLEMLGAHQGEHLVTLSDQQIVAEPGDNTFHGAASSLRNDRRIIDVALLWNAEIGVTGNVVFVSNDRGAIDTAKRHNLPAVRLDEINQALSRTSTPVWTAPVLKSCMASAMTYGGKQLSSAPVQSVRSVYAELQSATVLVNQLADTLTSLDTASTNSTTDIAALLALARESVNRWEALIQAQQVGPKKIGDVKTYPLEKEQANDSQLSNDEPGMSSVVVARVEDDQQQQQRATIAQKIDTIMDQAQQLKLGRKKERAKRKRERRKQREVDKAPPSNELAGPKEEVPASEVQGATTQTAAVKAPTVAEAAITAAQQPAAICVAQHDVKEVPRPPETPKDSLLCSTQTGKAEEDETSTPSESK